MVTKVLQLGIDKEKQIFWTLFGILLFCVCFYIYSVNATVRDLVAHQNLEDEATGLSLSLGKQEFKYIEMRNAIDLATAYSLGFKNVSNKTFVSNKSVSVISMNQGVPPDSSSYKTLSQHIFSGNRIILPSGKIFFVLSFELSRALRSTSGSLTDHASKLP